MPTFEIPDGPTAIDAPRSGDSKDPQPAESSAVYSVTNTTSDSVVGRLGVKIAGASKEEWFTVDGDRERTFDPGETQTATVKVKFPPEVAQGDYPFRLRAVAVNDPDNDHAEGPMTTAKLGPGRRDGTRSWWWLWILLGVLAVLAIGGGLFYFLGQEKPSPPVENVTVANPTPKELDTTKALQLAEKKTIEWLDAFNARDADALASLSEPPFILEDSPLFVSEIQIRDVYAAYAASDRQREQKIYLNSITPQQITEVKILNSPDGRKILRVLKLSDDDVAVVADARGGTLYFLFRRSPNDVKLAGVLGELRELMSGGMKAEGVLVENEAG